MEIQNEAKKIFQDAPIKIISGIILGLIILLLVFRLGMLVGYRKAGFAYGWGENYERNFGGRMGEFGRPGGPGDLLRDLDDRRFMGADGTVGRIIKIDQASIVVKGQADEEKIILLNGKTLIRRFRDNIKPADLRVDDMIVVIGEPNQAGQIEAKLIRLIPAPPALNQLTPPATGTSMPASAATSTKSK
jgi:hypothetical protein